MAASADRDTRTRKGDVINRPVAATTTIYAGTMVQRNAAGNAVPASATAANKTLGIAEHQVANPGGAGDKRIDIRRDMAALLGNSAGNDAIGAGDIGNDCYVVDDVTVAKTDADEVRPVAGKVLDVETAGVWVEFD